MKTTEIGPKLACLETDIGRMKRLNESSHEISRWRMRDV